MKNMVMLDANVILRYLLNDNEEMASEAEKAIKSQTALITIEVIAEVVYVLKRVYAIDKAEIKESVLGFLSETEVEEREVLVIGLEIYAEQNLDFVDCILYAYRCVKKYDILTFDKKLKKLLANM